MSLPAIEVKNLSKKFIIQKNRLPYQTLRDNIGKMIKKPIRMLTKPGKPSETEEVFWALKDMDFKVEEGQVMGIIGRNGAGKSTLLKIMSRITPPTKGSIHLRGRVASLLEVGTGFNPELSGRENVFLNGAILGMTRREIRKKFDEIVAFSGVEKFIDTPVKRYSSGMYVRLAFAVAAHLEPEILIIDEVLSVGDAEFQKKSLGKMQDVATNQGRTVLFVSHSMPAVTKLCDRCILMEQGTVLYEGRAKDAVNEYLSMNIVKTAIYEQASDPTKDMNLRQVVLNPSTKGAGSNSISYEDDIVIRVEYEVNNRVRNCGVWIALQTAEGVMVLCTADYDLNSSLRGIREPGNYRAEVKIPGKWLNTGEYDVIIGINQNEPTVVYDRKETIRFEVVDLGSSPKSIFNEGTRNGVLQPFLPWENAKLS